MNNNLLNVIKEIVEKNGETILSEPRRISAFLADLARDEPKPQKYALIKCLEHGCAQTLKNVPLPEREVCKERLAQKLHDEEGLDLGLCGETIELLSAVLFGEEEKQKKTLCKNCGKELQEEWKACPYCGAAATAIENYNTIVSSETVNKDTEFNVILITFDNNRRIAVLKEIRAIKGWGLKEALDLVEGLPSLLKEKISKEEANRIKSQFNAIGGTVEIQPSNQKIGSCIS